MRNTNISDTDEKDDTENVRKKTKSVNTLYIFMMQAFLKGEMVSWADCNCQNV